MKELFSLLLTLTLLFTACGGETADTEKAVYEKFSFDESVIIQTTKETIDTVSYETVDYDKDGRIMRKTTYNGGGPYTKQYETQYMYNPDGSYIMRNIFITSATDEKYWDQYVIYNSDGEKQETTSYDYDGEKGTRILRYYSSNTPNDTGMLETSVDYNLDGSENIRRNTQFDKNDRVVYNRTYTDDVITWEYLYEYYDKTPTFTCTYNEYENGEPVRTTISDFTVFENYNLVNKEDYYYKGELMHYTLTEWHDGLTVQSKTTTYYPDGKVMEVAEFDKDGNYTDYCKLDENGNIISTTPENYMVPNI